MIKYFLSLLIILFGLYIDLSFYYMAENLLFLYIFAFSSLSLALIVSLFLKRFYYAILPLYLLFVGIWIYWYGGIKPSNSREWQKDVAVLSYATFDKNLVTIHNIRNFKYRSETDYDVSYYDAVFDINKLNGMDFIATYWMGKNIAHTFLSFSFSDGRHLAMSVEVRKTKGMKYSMLRGFFKVDELYYVVADERDLIGVRTNIRKNPIEHVYLYQIKADTDDEKKVFINYLNKINELKDNPEFYNTLTTNCTTTIWHNSLIDKSKIPFSWKILLSGHTPKYLYEKNLLKTYGLSFENLQKKAYINPLVKDKNITSSYSFDIRRNLQKSLKFNKS